MSGTSVDLRGLEKVMSHYEFRDTPFYAVYCTKDLKFFHVEEDKEKGEAWLRDNLTLIENGGSTAIHKIEFYSEVTEKKKLIKENLIGIITFRLNQISDMAGGETWNRQQVPALYRTREIELMEKILENQNAMESRVKALETLEPETEEETPASMGMKMISGVFDNPQMQQAFAQRFLGFIDMIMPLKPNQRQQSPASVGNATITTDEIVTIETAVQTLLNNGMTVSDLTKLSEISVKDPGQFTFLLKTLRNLK